MIEGRYFERIPLKARGSLRKFPEKLSLITRPGILPAGHYNPLVAEKEGLEVASELP